MMIKNLLTLLFIGISSFLTAQTSTEKDLEIIETPEQIESFLQAKNSRKNKLITFNEEKHKTILSKELFELSKGGVKTIKSDFEEIYYKVVEKTEMLNYRVSYIVINDKNIKNVDLITLRESIIEKYKAGAPFDILAKRYSKDKNANRGGDTGWFTEGDNNYEFEKTIISDNHNLDDIYTIDMPSANKFYIVLKTFEPKKISEIKVLKIVEAIN